MLLKTGLYAWTFSLPIAVDKENDNDSNNPNCHFEDNQRKWHKTMNKSKYNGARRAINQQVGAGYGPNYISAWLYIVQDMWGEN